MTPYPRYPPRRRRRRGPGIAGFLLLAGAAMLVLTTVAFLRPSGADQMLAGNLPVGAPGGSNQQALTTRLQSIISASGARVGVALIDLRGGQPIHIGDNSSASFDAASTYKLPLLMADAERIAAGTASPADTLCFDPSDQEDGWFDDYQPGDCFTRQELAERVGIYSDNTAAHILVDDLGGPAALNAYARSRGATASSFYDPNQTTAGDLANLWRTEAQGRAGGGTAQRWLYPLLTQTRFESGIPAGVPGGVTVVHKIGDHDSTVDDAALVSAGGSSYVLAVTTDGMGGDAAWSLVAHISAAVWSVESGS